MSEIKRDFLSRLFIKSKWRRTKKFSPNFRPPQPPLLPLLPSLLLLLDSLLLLHFLGRGVGWRQQQSSPYSEASHTRYTIILKQEERERMKETRQERIARNVWLHRFLWRRKKEGNGEQSKEKRFKKKGRRKGKKESRLLLQRRFTLSSLLLLCILNHRKRRTQHKFPLSLSLSLTDQHAIILPLTLDQTKILVTWNSPWNSGFFDRKKKRIMWRHLKFKQKSL